MQIAYYITFTNLHVHLLLPKTVHFNIPITINTSPTCIFDKVYTHSLRGFSGYIKAFMLQFYWENCIFVDYYVCNTQT